MTENLLSLPHSFEGVRKLVDRLRSQEGCPWDKEQTAKTLAPMLVEECHELVEAIENGDVEGIIEELGDVIFHMAFQLHIGASEKVFSDGIVFSNLIEKYIRRHPHVFDGQKVETREELIENWEAVKRAEKKGARKSVIDGIPSSLPALVYATAVQKRASRTGFDWDHITEVKAKVIEELDEIELAQNHTEKEEEFGDLLFTLVNIARKMKIDPEQSLRLANRKFSRRFFEMEELSKKMGLEFLETTLPEKDSLWDEVKKMENHEK